MEIAVYCVVGIICGFIGGAITEGKGRGSGEGFMLGLILGVIGIIIAAVLPRNVQAIEAQNITAGTGKKCPYCAEIIKKEAKVCRYCGRDLIQTKNIEINPPTSPNRKLPQPELSRQIPNCPQCGVPMKIAKATKGEFQGQDFYVCPNYQQCKQYWNVYQP